MYKLTYRWGHWLFILALAAFIGAAFGLRPLHLTGSQYWSDIPVWALPLGMLVLSFVPAFLWKGERTQVLLVGLTNLSAMFFFASLTNLTGDPILKNPDGLIVNYVSMALAIVGGLLTTVALCSTSRPVEAKAAATPVQPAAKAAVEGQTPAPVKEEQPSLEASAEAAKESTPVNVAATVAAAGVAAEVAPASKDGSPASVAPASKDASVTDNVASKEASASQTQLKAAEPEKPKGLGGSQLGAKAAASNSGVKLQSLLEKLDPEMKAASSHKPSIKSASPAASAPAVPGSGTAKASETSTNLPDQKKAASTTATRLQAQKRKSTATFSKLQALSASGTGTTTRSTASPADESSDSLKSILDRLDTKGGFDQYDGPEDILSPNESLLTPPEVAEANRPTGKFADMPKPAAKPEEPKKPAEKTKPAESGKSFARSESGKLDSGKLDPAQLDSGKLDSGKLDSAKVEPVKPEPAAKPQAVKPAQPAKAEIVKIETTPAAKTPPVKPAPLESVTAPKPAEGPSLSSMLDAMESKMPKSEAADKSELSAAGGDAAAEAPVSDKGYTNEELHAIPTPKVSMSASGTHIAARTSEEPQTEFAPPAEGPKPDIIVPPDTTVGAEAAAAEGATAPDITAKEPDANAGGVGAIAADISAIGNADYKFGTAETVAKIEAAAETTDSAAKADATTSGAAASEAGVTDNLFGSKIDQDIDDIFSNLVPAEAQREVQALNLGEEQRAADASETPASFIELRSDKEEEKAQVEAAKAAEPEPTKAAIATPKTPVPEPAKAATATPKTPPEPAKPAADEAPKASAPERAKAADETPKASAPEPTKAADETPKVPAPEPTKAAAPASDNLFGTQIDQDIDDIFSAIVPIEAQKEVKESPYSVAYGEKEEAAPTPEPASATISPPAEISAPDVVAKETAQPEAKAEAAKLEATAAAEVVAPAPTPPREEEKPAAEPKRKDTLFDPSLEKDLDDLFSALAPEDAQKNVSSETLAKFKPADQEPISFQPASPQPEEKALVEQEPLKFNETLHHLPGIQGTVESLLNNLAGSEGMPAEAPAAEGGEVETAEPVKPEPPAPLNALDIIESLAAESKAEKASPPAVKAEAQPAKAKIESAKAEVEPAKAEIEPAKAEVEPAKAEIEPTKAEVEPAKAEIEPAKAEAEPAKAEIEPAKVEVEPAKAEIEPAKVEVEPAKAEIESTKAEAEPVMPAPEPVETAQAVVAKSDTEPADPRDTAQKIEAIKAQAEAHAQIQSEPADEQAEPQATDEQGEPIEGDVPLSMRSTVDIGQALKDAEKSKQLTALEKQLKEFGRLSTKSTKPQADEPVGTMKTIGKLLIEVQAVENIIKTGEATGKLGSGLSTARVISAARGEGIKALLTKIDSYSSKVKGSVIVGHDGLVIASTLPPDMNQDALGALSMASIGTSNMATKKLEIGKLRQMVLITDRNISVLTDVDVGILSVFLDDISIDLVDGLIDAIHETIHG